MLSLARRLRDHWSEYGARETFQVALARASERLNAKAFHRRIQPSLNDLFAKAVDMRTDPGDLLARHLLSGAALSIEALLAEYNDVTAEIERRYAQLALGYPADWAVGASSAFLLYGLVRASSPGLVLETGVANGHSSFLILSALARNGDGGRLVSVDIDPSAGRLLEGSDLSAWRSVTLARGELTNSFAAAVSELPRIDLFLHDSDHRYQWQLHEYRNVIGKMSAGGILASDDVDASFAFLDFCAEEQLSPLLLVDVRKVFGFARVPDDRAGDSQAGGAAMRRASSRR